MNGQPSLAGEPLECNFTGADATSESIDGTPENQSEGESEEEVEEADGFQIEKKSELVRVGTSSLDFSRSEVLQAQALHQPQPPVVEESKQDGGPRPQ